MPPAKLGLIYGHTGLQRFIDAIGVPRTKELFLTGNNVTAERAEELGLVNQVTDDGDLEAAAVELAAEIAANAPLSMRGNKHAIDTLNSYSRLTPEQERELIELRESCFRSEDFREGVAAFAGSANRSGRGANPPRRARAPDARRSPRGGDLRPWRSRATRSCRRSPRPRPAP